MTTRAALLCISMSMGVTASCDRAARQARIDVKDAPAHERESVLTVNGAKIVLDKGGAYDRVCTSHAPTSKGQSGCVDHHFYVFPLVPEAWAPSDPVPAWITCTKATSLEQCRASASSNAGDITGKVAVRVGDKDKLGRAESGWEKAIDDAAKRHGVIVAPRGPVLWLG